MKTEEKLNLFLACVIVVCVFALAFLYNLYQGIEIVETGTIPIATGEIVDSEIETTSLGPCYSPVLEFDPDDRIEFYEAEVEQIRIEFLDPTKNRVITLPDRDMDWQQLLADVFDQGYQAGLNARE